MVSGTQKHEAFELQPMKTDGMQHDAEALVEEASLVENESPYKVLISNQRTEPVVRTYVCRIEMIY